MQIVYDVELLDFAESLLKFYNFYFILFYFLVMLNWGT